MKDMERYEMHGKIMPAKKDRKKGYVEKSYCRTAERAEDDAAGLG